MNGKQCVINLGKGALVSVHAGIVSTVQSHFFTKLAGKMKDVITIFSFFFSI